ncbi:hypothetical protein B0J13DRAFT_521559 [Dactylonectria estremocensis]|uniref:Uncharacterized protein n=1 Tax=Dactylonectria estremocensis TaxID=1079267 RepID=A0A9P9JEQ4_9HYPO|nr:hypothetical protein B0J13DRAFT_521559 [Dactylonectria estremocensis]
MVSGLPVVIVECDPPSTPPPAIRQRIPALPSCQGLAASSEALGRGRAGQGPQLGIGPTGSIRRQPPEPTEATEAVVTKLGGSSIIHHPSPIMGADRPCAVRSAPSTSGVGQICVALDCVAWGGGSECPVAVRSRLCWVLGTFLGLPSRQLSPGLGRDQEVACRLKVSQWLGERQATMRNSLPYRSGIRRARDFHVTTKGSLELLLANVSSSSLGTDDQTHEMVSQREAGTLLSGNRSCEVARRARCVRNLPTTHFLFHYRGGAVLMQSVSSRPLPIRALSS